MSKFCLYCASSLDQPGFPNASSQCLISSLSGGGFPNYLVQMGEVSHWLLGFPNFLCSFPTLLPSLQEPNVLMCVSFEHMVNEHWMKRTSIQVTSKQGCNFRWRVHSMCEEVEYPNELFGSFWDPKCCANMFAVGCVLSSDPKKKEKEKKSVLLSKCW